MEYWSSYVDRQQGVTIKSVFDFTPLSKPQKDHLSKVYAMIFSGVLISAIGVYMQQHFIQMPSFLLLLMKIASLMGIVMTRHKAVTEGEILDSTRLGCFIVFCSSLGMTISDYVTYVHYHISSAIVPTAFLGSIAIFICFSVGAMLTKERSLLYIGGILSTGMTYMLILSFSNIFFQSIMMDNALLYIGIALYVGFVVYDTQVTLLEFDRGNKDYLIHALELYMDLFSLFIRLLKVLVKNRDEGNWKDERVFD